MFLTKKNRFNSKIKNNKRKYFCLDLTIEEAFDESNFEQKLEEYIKKCAQSSEGITSSGKTTSKSEDDQIIHTHTGHNIYVNNPLQATTSPINMVLSTPPTCAKCAQNSRKEATHERSLKSSAAPLTPPSPVNTKNKREEMGFLQHAFSLIKFAGMDELFQQFTDPTGSFFDGMVEIIRENTDHVIKLVTS